MQKNLNKADKVYHDLLQDILDNGHQKGDRTGTGTTSVFGRQIRFNMKDGFPVLTTKRLHLKSIIHELLWFLKGDTNIKYLKDNGVSIWDEWADENGDLGPVYGKQWVSWSTNEMVVIGHTGTHNEWGTVVINQIQNMIDRLKTAPDCRRIIVSAWNVADLPKMKLMPCHYGFQVWTRELTLEERVAIWDSKFLKDLPKENYMDNLDLDSYNIPKREISLMWNQRSVDTFLGLPFNIASYGILLEMIAQQVNMVPGELIGNLGDTHLYSNHIDFVEKQLERESKECSPKLILNKANSLFDYKFEDFELTGYEAHTNWKGVPIAV